MSEKESANRLQSLSRAFQGFVVGIILIYAALINIDFGGFHVGFVFLPVAAIFLWPRKASHSWSLIFIFMLGFFHDIISAGPLGVWAICYLGLFVLLGGGVSQKIGHSRAYGGFALSVGLVMVLTIILGRIATGHWPGWVGLFVNALSAILLFPLIFWLRNLAYLILADPEKREAV